MRYGRIDLIPADKLIDPRCRVISVRRRNDDEDDMSKQPKDAAPHRCAPDDSGITCGICGKTLLRKKKEAENMAEIVNKPTPKVRSARELLEILADENTKEVFDVLSAREKEDIGTRFTYVPPKEGQPETYEMLRRTAKEFASVIVLMCPDSRERSLALTHLEETLMWANAAVARHS